MPQKLKKINYPFRINITAVTNTPKNLKKLQFEVECIFEQRTLCSLAIVISRLDITFTTINEEANDMLRPV